MDLSNVGLEEYITIELPFLSKPTSLWKEGSATLPSSSPGDQSPSIKAILKGVEDYAVANVSFGSWPSQSLDTIYLVGLDTYLMLEEKDVRLKACKAVEDSVNLFLSKKIGGNAEKQGHTVVLTININLSLSILPLFSSFSNLRLTLHENEGGYSDSISGQLIAETWTDDERTVRIVKFKTTSKGLEFFETLNSQ